MVQMEISAPVQALPAVVWNYEEVKAGVKKALEQYKNRAYTAQTITGAKADRSALNKLAEAMAVKRREMKARYLEPYTAFEAQCKEIEGMISQVSGQIDTQVKEYENAEKEAKRKEIAAYYSEAGAQIVDQVPLDAVFNPKWLNKTYRMESIKAEIDAMVARILESMETIRTSCGQDVAACLETYLHGGLDLAEAIRKHQALEKVRRDEAAREEQKAREAMPQRLADLRSSLTGEPVQKVAQAVQTPQAAQKTAQHMDFRVYYTSKAQLMGLRQYMMDNGIKYGRVPAAE